MRMGFLSRRRGFTLVETVVTVGIVAALAAVVYPTVVKQLDSADPARAAEDLNTLSTAIATFGVNVRPHQPSDIEDLVNQIRSTLANGDTTALGSAYTAADSANWKGPYLGASVINGTVSTDTVITTGFGGVIRNRLPLFDIDDVTPPGGDTVAYAAAANADFVSVMILGLSGSAFNAINLLIDGPSENASADVKRQNGRFRCPGAGGATDADACSVAFYLAQPLRK